MPRKLKTDPEIIEMPDRKMAVVEGKGAPDDVFPKLFPVLYKAVYGLKFDLKKKGLETFKVEPPRARYPGDFPRPKEEWVIIAGVPIPEDTVSFPAKASPDVKIQTWRYGTVAQIMHIGSYSEETAPIARLHKFIADSGYERIGPHEEEYLTKPDSKIIKTMIRYQIKKKV